MAKQTFYFYERELLGEEEFDPDNDEEMLKIWRLYFGTDTRFRQDLEDGEICFFHCEDEEESYGTEEYCTNVPF